MIADPDNVTLGIAQLPQALQQPNTAKWLAILLSRVDDLQAFEIDYLNQLLIWDQLSADTDDYILDWLGALLGQPRPDGANSLEYKRILLVRRLVRLSSGTQPQVREIVTLLGSFGGGASTGILVPHTVIVTFANFAAVAALGFSLSVVVSLLSDAIGDHDRLQIFDAVGTAFTWGLEGQGWGQGVWSVPLYDSED